MFFMRRFADLNCLVSLKEKIQVENRDNWRSQEATIYRSPIKNIGENNK